MKCVMVGLLLVVQLFSPEKSAAELKPGDVLDQSNWQEAKGLLPEEVLKYFAAGEARASIVEAKDEWYRLDPEFQRFTEENAGKYEINEQGRLIESATKSYPHWWRGLPFPKIDPQDPQAATKIVYNQQALRWAADDLATTSARVIWVGPRGKERYIVSGAVQMSFINRPSGPLPNPDDLWWKEVNYGIAPYELAGTSTMTWYYNDPGKWPSVWSFIPTIRRVRRLAASNMSDGFFGSAIARNDFNIFIGPVSYFNWKIIGEQDLLVPIATSDGPRFTMKRSAPLQYAVLPPNNPVWRVESPINLTQWGFNTPDWTGAQWWPVNWLFAKRRVWVIEGSAKDPYYAYGRWIAYHDKQLPLGYYKIIYSRGGEYWKTLLNADLLITAEDGTRMFKLYSGLVARDDRQNVTNVHDLIGKNDDGLNMMVETGLGIANDMITTSVMMKTGK